MRNTQIEVPSKRKYSRISFKKRELLVKAICSEGQNLTQVSKKLKINASTARMILRKYNQTGEFRTKNFKNKRNTDLSTITLVPNQKKGQQNTPLEFQRQFQKFQSIAPDYTLTNNSIPYAFEMPYAPFYQMNPSVVNFWTMFFPINL